MNLAIPRSTPSRNRVGRHRSDVRYPRRILLSTWSASQAFNGGFTAAAAATITVASATAFAVGRQGATDAAFLVHSSTASQATGIQVTGKAAASGAALAVISSGTNEALTIDAKGSGTITLGGTSTGLIVLSRAATLIDGAVGTPALRFASDTDTGIYWETSQKLSFAVDGGTRAFLNASVLWVGVASVQFNGTTTTGSAANAFLDGADSNRLYRSTSSLRYKQDVRDLTLDEAWRVVDGARAIAFRDKARPEKGEHVGLAAEEVAALDPRLVTYDAEGRVDWVQYPHLTAPLLVALADVRRRMEAAGLWA